MTQNTLLFRVERRKSCITFEGKAASDYSISVMVKEIYGLSVMRRWAFVAVCGAILLMTVNVGGQVQEPVKAAHENLEPGTMTDDVGVTIGIPASHPARRYPATEDFPTGPEIGERLPEFSLLNQEGRLVNFHADRGDSKSIVVFYRSAVW